MNNKTKGGISGMLIATIVMVILALVFVLIGYFRGGGEHIEGLKAAWNMIIRILPLLIAAFIVAGMVEKLIPQEALSSWIGEESGIKGILIGTIAGGLTPGGPYVAVPLSAGFLSAGASIGTVISFLTGWSLLAFARMPIEVGILGWKVALIRFGTTFLFAPLAGIIAQFLFSGKV